MALDVPFSRMNGLGNEILVADLRGRPDRITPAAAVALAGKADTHFDQIMAIHDPRTSGTDADIIILNADGSEAGACGNGTRCVVLYLGRGTGTQEYLLQTRRGILEARALPGGLISVDMGVPLFDWQDIPLAHAIDDTNAAPVESGPEGAPVLSRPALASMGNPHAVFFIDRGVQSLDLARFGAEIEHHPLFPDRVNVSIAEVTGPTALTMRTFERGVGLTQACGSAACAAAVLAARTGRAGRRLTVTVPGGDLIVEWRDDGHVMMTGPAELEWDGWLDPVTGDHRRAPQESAD